MIALVLLNVYRLAEVNVDVIVGRTATQLLNDLLPFVLLLDRLQLWTRTLFLR